MSWECVGRKAATLSLWRPISTRRIFTTILSTIPPRLTASISSVIFVGPVLPFGKSATGFVWNTVFPSLRTPSAERSITANGWAIIEGPLFRKTFVLRLTRLLPKSQLILMRFYRACSRRVMKLKQESILLFVLPDKRNFLASTLWAKNIRKMKFVLL
ncbi:hypothetical protein SDC9_171285 [bioreactor metagenome]|uniref:Uncharacterized protein n=1 Tax=bioreactor metagenome TaxID=1076179 RepID=A0A645GD14_9ZZZZ